MEGQENLESIYPKVVDEIKEILKQFPDFVQKHCLDMVDYNCKGGKHIRALLVISSYLEILGINANSPEAYISFLIGFTLEFIHCSLLIADDWMDGSSLRRGQECWYLRKGIGSSAINDTTILENLSFTLIQNHLGKELTPEIYNDLICIFRDVLAHTSMGQTLDVATTIPLFSNYDTVVTGKTSLYTIYLPVAAGCLLSGKFKQDLIDATIKPLLLKIGYYFQAQDDFLDVYGDIELTGKIGTDIPDGKLSWLACKAYEKANESQKKMLSENLGKKDNDCIQKVLHIFNELKIKEEFLAFMTKESEEIIAQTQALPQEFPKETIKMVFASISTRSS